MEIRVGVRGAAVATAIEGDDPVGLRETCPNAVEQLVTALMEPENPQETPEA